MAGKFLADEISFRGPIPDDLLGAGVRGKLLTFYDPYETRDRESNLELTNNQLLRFILKNTDIDILLRTLGTAFFSRVVTVDIIHTRIIAANRYPRGYILINPNTNAISTPTIFPAGTAFLVGTTTSAAFAVGAFQTARFFFDITNIAAGGTISVNLQTQDPVTAIFATAQTDIFGGANTVGTFYASVGEVGVDQNLRLQVVVTVDPAVGSIGGVFKGSTGIGGGPTIFLGNEDVNTIVGYPLLSAQKETLYLRENTEIFGIATVAVNLNIFELQ